MLGNISKTVTQSIACRLLCFLSLAISPRVLHAEDDRQIHAATMSQNGIVVLAITDYDAPDLLVAIASDTGRVLWKQKQSYRMPSLAFSADGKTLAVGFAGIDERDPSILLLESLNGQREAALGGDEKRGFYPGDTYARWGNGVEALSFSPSNTLLYGLSNDTLFAWDLQQSKYLWTKEVPGLVKQFESLPYGHAVTFALSPDEKRIAVTRDSVYILTAGRQRPRLLVERAPALQTYEPSRPAYSPDGRSLAAGTIGPIGRIDGPIHYATDIWTTGKAKRQEISDCGGGIAWTADGSKLACQNASGTYLRSLTDLTKNVAPPAPPSDLPILSSGDALYVLAYKRTDWKNPSQPLKVDLVELQTGKRLHLTIPGR